VSHIAPGRDLAREIPKFDVRLKLLREGFGFRGVLNEVASK
jgi:hypothetical protein